VHRPQRGGSISASHGHRDQAPAKIIGVEPVGAAAMYRSLQENRPVTMEKVETVADGLAAPFGGQHTLNHMRRYVDDVVLVSDEQIVDALGLIMERCKLFVEPAAAASLAALLHGKVNVPAGARVVCVLSGGNIDLHRLKQIL
jgi:threonine dehydratase